MPSIIEVLATIYKFRKEGIGIWDDWWSSINHTPVFTIKAPFIMKPVIITEPSLIKEILGSPLNQYQHKPKLFYDILFSEMLKDGLVASHPNIWKPHRKILNQYFTHKRLQYHLKTINKYGNAIIQNLKNSFSKDEIKADEFFPILYDKILSVILDILLGEELMREMGTREIPTKFRQWKWHVVYRFLNPHNIIPFIWKINPRRKTYLNAISYFNNYMEEAISKSSMAIGDKQVYENDGSGNNLSCIGHMLLHNLSKKEMMDEISSILIAGHETTDTTFHFILQHLAEHPHIQRKCQDEIDFVFYSKENQLDVTVEDLSELKYLEQCILEALRLTPTIPGFARELNEKTQTENYIFEKGTILLFSSWLIHRNPDIYPEPEVFDPDRFLPEIAKARKPYTFLPFSMGSRNCIGWKFAMMELKTIMVWILRNYDISTSDKLENVKLHFDITLLPDRPFNLVLHKRNI